MNFRGKGKGSFQYHKEVDCIVANFICEKSHLKLVNNSSVRISKISMA